MKNTTITRKSLLFSGFALLLSALLLAGTTFAWFTDTVTNEGNTIQSGTFDVRFSGNRYAGGNWEAIHNLNRDSLIHEENWEPGQWNAVVINVSNFHNDFSAKVDVSFTITAGNEQGGLAEALWYKLTPIVSTQATAERAGVEDYLAFAQADSRPATDNSDVKPMTEIGKEQNELTLKTDGEIYAYYLLEYGMYTDASNEYQGKTFGLEFTVNATQATGEADGFGNTDYDAAASLYAVYGQEIVDKLNDTNTSIVVAGENIDMNNSMFDDKNGNDTFVIPDGKTLDLNGNAFIRPASGSGSGLAVKKGTTAVVKNGTLHNEGDMTLVDVEYGASLTFENVDFVGCGDDAIHVRANGNSTKATLIFRNCTFTNAGIKLTGMNGASEVDVQFENCTFTGTYKMYDEDGNVLTDPHGNIHYTTCLIDAESYYLYGNISVKNCTFDLDCAEAQYKQNIISLYGCNYSGNMLDVTLEDVTMTGKNVVPVDIDSRYDDGLIFTETNTSYTVDDVVVNYNGTQK